MKRPGIDTRPTGPDNVHNAQSSTCRSWDTKRESCLSRTGRPRTRCIGSRIESRHVGWAPRIKHCAPTRLVSLSVNNYRLPGRSIPEGRAAPQTLLQAPDLANGRMSPPLAGGPVAQLGRMANEPALERVSGL